MTTLPNIIPIDPLRMLPLREVASRMGCSHRTITKWLAEDAKDRRPGRKFPVPVSGRRGQFEWHELTLVEWLRGRHKQEQQ